MSNTDDIYHTTYVDNTIGIHADQKSNNGGDLESNYGSFSSHSKHANKLRRKELDEQLALDKGWRRTTLKVNTPEGRKNKSLDYYATGYSPNTNIRCPVTGMYTNCRVGTRDEDLFFTVCMSDGYKGQKTPDHLYYNTPDDYERHWNLTLATPDKEKWYNRNLAERIRRSNL